MVNLIKLLLLTPATNATIEKKISAMKQIKIHLSTWHIQAGLTHLVAHNSFWDSIDKLEL